MKHSLSLLALAAFMPVAALAQTVAPAPAPAVPAQTSTPAPAPAAPVVPPAVTIEVAPPAALPDKITCQRFQSNCTADACMQIIGALQKDTERKIFTVRRTETVTYTFDNTGAVEKLRGEQAVFNKQRLPVMNYKTVTTDAQGKIMLTNKDRKGNINIRVEIEPASGFYLNFFLHTDGSIKEVPVGEPYLAYFGWCSPGDELLPPVIPVAPTTDGKEAPMAAPAPAAAVTPATPVPAPATAPAKP
jgi:hypothetical protein